MTGIRRHRSSTIPAKKLILFVTMRFWLPTFFAVALIQAGCAHANDQAAGAQIGFLAPTGSGVVSRIDYDVEVQGKTVDCYFLATPGTRIEILSRRATPQGWQGETSNVRVLDGPFSGERGYLLTTYIKPERIIHYDSDLVAKAAGVSPCPIGSDVNEAKVQELTQELFRRPTNEATQRARDHANSDIQSVRRK
jgi:hypothetical protein